MSEEKEIILPKRTTAEDVIRLIDARARKLDLHKIKTLGFADHGFDGTLIATYALGLLSPETKDLTKEGRELALAQEKDKPELFLKRLLLFDPYGLLLEAVFSKGHQPETPLNWIERWWGSHGYGNSQTNRDEGATSLARFAEFAGLGRYVTGRRGFQTRIEWDENAATKIRSLSTALSEDGSDDAEIRRSFSSSLNLIESNDPTKEEELKAPEKVNRKQSLVEIDENNVLTLNLGEGKIASLSLPSKVTLSEKKRLLALVELMVNVDENESGWSEIKE